MGVVVLYTVDGIWMSALNLGAEHNPKTTYFISAATEMTSWKSRYPTPSKSAGVQHFPKCQHVHKRYVWYDSAGERFAVLCINEGFK